MGKVSDVAGCRFGKLVVVDKIKADKGLLRRCLCDCGRYVDVKLGNLTSGNTKSCGCVGNEKRATRLVEYNKSKKLSLIGCRFGRLIVLSEDDHVNGNGEVLWNCKCDCGVSAIVSGVSLKRGKTKSCGCICSPDLIGMKFGRLQVVSFFTSYQNRRLWRCACECGKTVNVATTLLKNGDVTSCGCRKSETGAENGRSYFLSDNGVKTIAIAHLTRKSTIKESD